MRELGERLDARELTEWMAFFKLEPWGADVEDWRAALVAATVANTARDRRRAPFRVADFMPRREASRQQTDEEIAERLRAWAESVACRER